MALFSVERSNGQWSIRAAMDEKREETKTRNKKRKILEHISSRAPSQKKKDSVTPLFHDFTVSTS